MTFISGDLITTGSADATMKTTLCHMLGIEYPIIAAPMGPDLTGPELVAAVSNAGGLGILQAPFCTPQLFRKEIHRIQALTDKPFGVNLLLHFPIDDQVVVCLEERVPILSLFWVIRHRFVAGQAVTETVRSIHRGVTGSEPVVLIVFYSAAPGLSVSTLQEPGSREHEVGQ